jgi:hypothetical protein
MSVEFVVDPELTDELRERIVALWVDVTNAGGRRRVRGARRPAEVWPVAEARSTGVAPGSTG